jgi:hypothetical protein
MGYCDGDLSVQWIKGVGGRVMNLLTKVRKHCRAAPRPRQHPGGDDPAAHSAAR